MKSKFGNVITSCFWKRQFHEIHNFMNPQELFTILLISFLHANSGSLESIDVTVMPIVSGYFFVISFCQIGKASRYVIRKVISVQYLQAFLFIAIKFNTASCFLSQRSFEEESTSMLFFSVCCALPKNTVPICFLFRLFLSFYFHDECMYKKKTLRLNDQWWFAKAETRIFLF